MYARRFLLGARLISDGARDQEGDEGPEKTHDQYDEFFSTLGLVHGVFLSLSFKFKALKDKLYSRLRP